MERGSDKHGPVVDEEMKEEVRPIEQGAPVPSRVEDEREIEPVDFDDEDDALADEDEEIEEGTA
jgi:hypothetical protein